MKIKTVDIVYGVPFFTGLILQIFAVDLFRLTFISQEITVGLYLLSGIIGFFLLRQKVQGTFKNKILDLIVSLTYCIVSVGGTLTYILLAGNYYLADNNTTRQSFPVVKTGTLGKGRSSKCFQPYADIEKDGLTKEMVFKCNLPKDITAYKSMEITFSEGGLGFDIIRDKQLIE